MTDTTNPTEDDTEDTELSGQVALGDDTVCDDCGSSWNRVEWSYVAGRVELHTALGCYGGDRLTTSDLDAAAKFITDLTAEFPDAATALAAEAARMRTAITAVTAARA